MPRKPKFGVRFPFLFFLAGSLLWTSGCATVQLKRDEDALRALEQVCEYGVSNQKVEGAVWIKAESPEAKGQFPAEVEALSPGTVFMEVTNLIGETQARIKVDEQNYKIEVPGREARNEEGRGAWGGIPLEWAADLFLGRFPCPGDLKESDLSVRRELSDVIVAERYEKAGQPIEEYYYKVKSWGGKPWPEELRWTRLNSPALSVVFKFGRPDNETGAPLRWEAKSDRGEVKVRWRRRSVEEASK